MAAVCLLAWPSIASAQAWVNPKGELFATLRSDFQYSDGVWHGSILVTGLPVYAYNEQIAAEYVPVDHLSLGLAVDGNDIAYEGPQTLPGANFPLAHGSQDDGHFHANLTDLELEGRYQLYDGAFTFTPVIRGRIPLTDYEEKGYAAAGTHLAEIGAGFFIGKYGFLTDNLIVQFDATYTYVEKEGGGGSATEQFETDRTDENLVISYLLGDKWIAGVGAAFRWTFDGFDLGNYANLAGMCPTPGPGVTETGQCTLVVWHDPVLEVRYFAPVAFASYQFSRSWSLMLRVADVVWGSSTSDALSVGLTLGYLHNLLGR